MDPTVAPLALPALTALAAHPWAYPMLETVHLLGVALLLGNLTLLELRVFGLGAALPVQPLARLSLSLALVGFAFADERGEALLRAEYLFLDGQTYGLRSSPV